MIIRLRQRQRRARSPEGPNSAPRIPAERDESADSQELQNDQLRDNIKQGYEDVVHGQVDTDMYKNGVALNPLDKPDANDTNQTPPLDPAPGKQSSKSSKQ